MNIFATCQEVIFFANAWLAMPTMVLFLSTGIILTLKTRLVQIRAFPRFLHLIRGGVRKGDASAHTISAVRALMSAMSTTIGMGNIVGPSMAISIGGPGALFWILLYICFGSATKFAEVSFAIYSRTANDKGDIIGGPTQYLKLIHPALGTWYAALTLVLFTVWSSVQVNTIACMWSQEHIPVWATGLLVISILLSVVLGGVDRIGYFASRMVPLKFGLYVFFALVILLQQPAELLAALKAVWTYAFTSKAATGGVVGISLLTAMREGIYKGIFITEAGLGTASISHALANVEHPTDQGILALYSGIADIILCLLSGLLTIVTGVWLLQDKLNNTLIFEAFKLHAPIAGAHYALMFSVLLFVVTALIGNTYNGSQSYAALTNATSVRGYYLAAATFAYTGALVSVPLIWSLMDVVLFFVALPNLLGLLYLAFARPDVIRIRS